MTGIREAQNCHNRASNDAIYAPKEKIPPSEKFPKNIRSAICVKANGSTNHIVGNVSYSHRSIDVCGDGGTKVHVPYTRGVEVRTVRSVHPRKAGVVLVEYPYNSQLSAPLGETDPNTNP